MKSCSLRTAAAAVMLLCTSTLAIAGEADVIAAKVKREADGTWTFTVTIRSDDRDASFYCDRFEVISPNGGVLGVRELEHPHDDEQPFTRELRGVKIQLGMVRSVLIRAHHTARGYVGATLKVKLRD
ncbi:MAG: hypothetical protein ABI547_09575 [Betaproteobacteria bacterium]